MKFSRATFLTTLLCCLSLFNGCQHYADSTPRRYLEADHDANYRRVFRSPVPEDVTIVNSVVITYAWRPGVVTTDDFEFELLVPEDWIKQRCKKWYLYKQTGEFAKRELEYRKQHSIRSWYV